MTEDTTSEPRRRIVRPASPAVAPEPASADAAAASPAAPTTGAAPRAAAGRKPRAGAAPRPRKPKATAPSSDRREPDSDRPDHAEASSDENEDGDEEREQSDSGDDDFEPSEGGEPIGPEDEESEDGGYSEQDEPASHAPSRGSSGERSEAKLAVSPNDPLQAYLREVQRHPLLTPSEEQTLAQRYAASQDVDAAARLVTANLRLVVKIAYEYRRAYKNIMDLIQEGNIGLMQAVKKYDPNRGVKLSSYSAWWIRAYILRYIINNWRLVKLGTTQAQRKLFFNLNKEKAKLAALGIDPTPDVIAKNLGVEEQEAIEMERRLSSGEMSLDAPVGDNEGRPVSRIELLASGLAGPAEAVADEELSDIVRTKLVEFRTGLKGKDLDIFDKRLVADEPLTLQELGDQFGISRERVRQIEARLTMNLRNFLVQALGDAVET